MPMPRLIGPLASWDLLRLARRGQTVRARVLLAAGLLVALGTLGLNEFGPDGLFAPPNRSIREAARFGERFAQWVLYAQLAVLMLLAPAYAAGGLAEEKERHTFPLLLVTDLTPWEVFAGLLAGRVVFLLTVLAAGLPVLAGSLLYGGVSAGYVAVCYLVTAATVVLLAALAAAGAAAADTFRGALLRGYFLAAVVATGGMTVVLSPFAVLAALSHLQLSAPTRYVWYGVGYAAGELLLAAGVAWLGAGWVRKRPPVRRAVPVRPPVVRPLPAYVPVVRRRPPIGDGDPFDWKERHTRGTKPSLDDDTLTSAGQAVGAVVGLVVWVLLLVAVGGLLEAGAKGYEVAAGALVTAGVLGYLPYLIVAGAAGGRSIVVERQRNTLESLLAIPADRGAVLAAKWRAAVRTGRWWGWPAGLCLPLGMLASGSRRAAGASLLLVLAGVPLTASVGVWLSLRCRTATRALLLWLPAAGLLVFFQVLLYRMGDDGEMPLVGLLAVVVCGAAAGWFRGRAAAAFERYGRE